MSISTHYQGRAGAAYHRSQRLVDPDIRAAINVGKIARHLPSPGLRVVDFGCAEGAILSRLPASERIGVDAIDENRIAGADRYGLTIVTALADMPAGSADVVVSHHALEHVLNPLAEVKEMHRVLRHGGRLILYVPADDWRVQRRYFTGDRNHHLYTWTPLSLGNLLAEAGFEVSRCRVEHRATPGRLTAPLYIRLNRRVFATLTVLCAFLLRRREICAIATAM